MAGKSQKLKLAAIHEIIPEEIFVMILKMLDFKSLTMARGTCTEWRNVIDGFELLSLKNFCKCLFSLFSSIIYSTFNQFASHFSQESMYHLS